MVLRQEVLDAFETLGITPDTPADVARSTYKKLAFTHHPDRNHGDPSATQRFQKISRAWETCQRHYDHPSSSEVRESERANERRARGPYDGPRFSADDDIPLDDEEEELFFRFMFTEMLFNRFSYAGGRRFRAQRSGAGGGGVRVFSGGLAESQQRQELNRERQRRENEAYLVRLKELEREIAAEQAERDKAAHELVKQQEKLANAYRRAFSLGRAGNGNAMKNIIAEYNLDVNSPENQRKERQNQKPVAEYETLLHVAARSCDETVVQYLINKGANPGSLNNAKLTPFHTSVLSGNTRVVEWFVKQQRRKPMEGCHLSKAAPDATRRTPLQLAIASRVPEIVEMLFNDAPVHDVKRCWDILEKELGSAPPDNDRTRKLLRIRETLLKKKGFSPDVAQNNESKKALSKKALNKVVQLQVEAEAAARKAKLREEEAELARVQAEQEAQRRREEEEARKAAEREARRRMDEERRRVAEQEARRAAEKEAQRREEEKRRAAAEEARQQAEDARRAVEKEAQRQEEERRIAAEKEARRLANQARRQERAKRKAAGKQARQAAEREAQRREEEERKKAEEEARRAAEEEAQRQAEEKRRAAEKEARLAAEQEAQRLEEEKRRVAESKTRRIAEKPRRETEKDAHRAAKKDARRVDHKNSRSARKETGPLAGERAHRVEEEGRRAVENEANRLAAESLRLEYERRRAAKEEARSLAQETQSATVSHRWVPQEAAGRPRPGTKQSDQTTSNPTKPKPKSGDPDTLPADIQQRRAEQSARDKERHRRLLEEKKLAAAKTRQSETSNRTSDDHTSPFSPISTSSDFPRTPSDIPPHNPPNIALLDTAMSTDQLDIQTGALPESLFAFEPVVQHFQPTPVSPMSNTTAQHRNFPKQETRHVPLDSQTGEQQPPSNQFLMTGQGSEISGAASARKTQGRRGGQSGRHRGAQLRGKREHGSHPGGNTHDDGSVVSQLLAKLARQDNELSELRAQLSDVHK